MRISVTHLHNGTHHLYEGDPASVEQQLLKAYPFLRTGVPEHRGNMAFLLQYLDSCSHYLVEQDDEALTKSEGNLEATAQSQIVQDMLGFQLQLTEAFRAARFLAGGREVPFDQMRRALWEEDGDLNAAVLRAFGFVPDEANLKALDAVRGLDLVQKAERATPAPKAVLAATVEAQDVADAITRAYRDQFVFPVQLAGKHSKGALVARDQGSKKTWLLKPGSGGAGPAAGAGQDPSDEPGREAAWYHVAREWGLFDHFPRAELLIIDGKRYAAVELLPWSYVTMERQKVTEPNIARKVLAPLMQEGVLHQWAIMEFVCGNPDSHGQNLMVDKETDEVRLIDHGSAFAGPGFDPAHDKSSFVPAYLRAWAPLKFNNLGFQARLQYMPRVSKLVADRLRAWVARLDPVRFTAIVHRYGINPAPDLARLHRVKAAIQEMPADDAINRLWLST